MKLVFLKIAFVFFFFGQFILAQTAFKIPEKPNLIYPVNDYAGIFSDEEEQKLNQKLINYQNTTSTEILVFSITTLDGDDANFVAAKWGKKWGIGQKGKNNGIILLIAANDRKIVIQNGRGTEDVMTDYQSTNIIQNYFIPNVKKSGFYVATDLSTDVIIATLEGKFKNDIPNKKKKGEFGFTHFLIFLIIFIIIIFISRGNSNGGNNGDILMDRKGRRRYDGGFIFPVGGGSFGGSSGGSDSGFGGFGGGGDFGGGGASGDW